MLSQRRAEVYVLRSDACIKPPSKSAYVEHQPREVLVDHHVTFIVLYKDCNAVGNCSHIWDMKMLRPQGLS